MAGGSGQLQGEPVPLPLLLRQRAGEGRRGGAEMGGRREAAHHGQAPHLAAAAPSPTPCSGGQGRGPGPGRPAAGS